MGVSLSSIRKSGHYRTNWSGWRDLLETAWKNGWIPQGTTMDIRYEWEVQSLLQNKELDDDTRKKRIKGLQEIKSTWDGSYFSNSAQVVTDEDSVNLRKALEKFVATKKEFCELTDTDFPTDDFELPPDLLKLNPHFFNLPLSEQDALMEPYAREFLAKNAKLIEVIDKGENLNAMKVVDYIFIRNFITFLQNGAFVIT